MNSNEKGHLRLEVVSGFFSITQFNDTIQKTDVLLKEGNLLNDIWEIVPLFSFFFIFFETFLNVEASN